MLYTDKLPILEPTTPLKDIDDFSTTSVFELLSGLSKKSDSLWRILLVWENYFSQGSEDFSRYKSLLQGSTANLKDQNNLALLVSKHEKELLHSENFHMQSLTLPKEQLSHSIEIEEEIIANLSHWTPNELYQFISDHHISMMRDETRKTISKYLATPLSQEVITHLEDYELATYLLYVDWIDLSSSVQETLISRYGLPNNVNDTKLYPYPDNLRMGGEDDCGDAEPAFLGAAGGTVFCSRLFQKNEGVKSTTTDRLVTFDKGGIVVPYCIYMADDLTRLRIRGYQELADQGIVKKTNIKNLGRFGLKLVRDMPETQTDHYWERARAKFPNHTRTFMQNHLTTAIDR